MDKFLLSKGQSKVPGIYGGMGPASHVYFEKLLIQECSRKGIKKDQDYPVWIALNGSSTPDRTKSLSGDGSNALGHLVYFTKILSSMPVDFIVMICNTAHAYIDQVRRVSSTPVISLIELTKNFFLNKDDDFFPTCILATDGTLSSNLYQKSLSPIGKVVYPKVNSKIQNLVMDAIYNPIYGIKFTGDKVSIKAKNNLKTVLVWAKKKGAKSIITACTELSLAFSEIKTKLVVIDPLKIAAKAIIAHSQEKNEEIRGFTKQTTNIQFDI